MLKYLCRGGVNRGVFRAAEKEVGERETGYLKEVKKGERGGSGGGNERTTGR
jgi:hypothetical protein